MKENDRNFYNPTNLCVVLNYFREAIFQLTTKKPILTNPRCVFKTNIVCDRSEPKFVVDLIPDVHGKLDLV